MGNSTSDINVQPADAGRFICPRWLRFFLLILAGLNLYTASGTVAESSQLQAFDLPFSLTARVVFTGLWALVLLFLAIGSWWRNRQALFWIGPLITLYATSGLVWMFLFARADYDRGRFGFQIVVTVVFLIPVWWVVVRRGWLRRGTIAVS